MNLLGQFQLSTKDTSKHVEDFYEFILSKTEDISWEASSQMLPSISSAAPLLRLE